MRFVQFRYKPGGKSNLGVLLANEQIVDLVEIGVNNLVDFIAGGQQLLDKAKQ